MEWGGGEEVGRRRWDDNIDEGTWQWFADSQMVVKKWESWRELLKELSVVPQRSLWVMGQGEGGGRSTLFTGHKKVRQGEGDSKSILFTEGDGRSVVFTGLWTR